jgi:hypothetical protein
MFGYDGFYFGRVKSFPKPFNTLIGAIISKSIVRKQIIR